MVKTTHRILMEWKLIPFLKGKHNWGEVLDIGSKDARYKKHIRCHSYTSLDIEPKYQPDIVGDIEFYSSTKKYDTVIMTQVLEHVKNPEIVLKNISGLLKTGGVLVMTTPFIFQEHGQDFGRWTELGLRIMLERYFKNINVMRYGNFISSSWDVLHFFNRIPILNYVVAYFSLILSGRHCPCGFLTEAIK